MKSLINLILESNSHQVDLEDAKWVVVETDGHHVFASAYDNFDTMIDYEFDKDSDEYEIENIKSLKVGKYLCIEEANKRILVIRLKWEA